MRKRFLLFTLFLVVFSFCFFGSFEKVYAADVEMFENWVNENRDELNELLQGYEYLIVNNVYRNHISLYYAPSNDTVFTISEEGAVSGSRRVVLSASSSLGDNVYDVKFFNDNNDNNFSIPVLNYGFGACTGDNRIINNYSLDNVLYASSAFTADGVNITTKKALPLPGKLAPVVEKVEVEMGTVLLEIVKIIPLILVVVVSFLGLRKALRMLSTLLHRC